MPLPYFFGGQKTYIYWMNQLIDAVNALVGGGSGVQTVTGLATDNTDPQNPIVAVAVDGVTVTGAGTLADPLVAAVPATGRKDQGGAVLRASMFG